MGAAPQLEGALVERDRFAWRAAVHRIKRHCQRESTSDILLCECGVAPLPVLAFPGPVPAAPAPQRLQGFCSTVLGSWRIRQSREHCRATARQGRVLILTCWSLGTGLDYGTPVSGGIGGRTVGRRVCGVCSECVQEFRAACDVGACTSAWTIIHAVHERFHAPPSPSRAKKSDDSNRNQLQPSWVQCAATHVCPETMTAGRPAVMTQFAELVGLSFMCFVIVVMSYVIGAKWRQAAVSRPYEPFRTPKKGGQAPTTKELLEGAVAQPNGPLRWPPRPCKDSVESCSVGQ